MNKATKVLLKLIGLAVAGAVAMIASQKKPASETVDDSVECDFEDDADEALSVYDAAEIWLANGRDEDYTFGYTEAELERAL